MRHQAQWNGSRRAVVRTLILLLITWGLVPVFACAHPVARHPLSPPGVQSLGASSTAPTPDPACPVKAQASAPAGTPNLRGGQFARQSLAGEDLHGGDLREANFAGANLAGADLHNADLRNANFSRA